jgi:hypothetical protein
VISLKELPVTDTALPIDLSNDSADCTKSLIFNAIFIIAMMGASETTAISTTASFAFKLIAIIIKAMGINARNKHINR